MPVKSRTRARSAQSASAPKHDAITRQLAQRIGEHRYDMWFQHARLDVAGTTLRVSTNSPFVAKWIDTHYARELRGVAEETLGGEATVDIRVEQPAVEPDATTHGRGRDASGRDEPPQPAAPPAPERRSRRQRTSSAKSGGRTDFSLRNLDEFIVGASNRLAYTAAQRLIEDPGISPLFVHGECGLGKTHLLQGMCRALVERLGDARRIRYVTGEQFTNEYVTAVRRGNLDAFREKHRSLDVLAIDDVHFLANKVRTQSEFLYTLDAIALTGARVVLSADEHPRQLKQFSRALISRFISGMVVQLDAPDRATRTDIIRHLARERDLNLNDAACEIIASNCVGSVREIEGALTKLSALKMLADGCSPAGAPSGENEIGAVFVQQLFKDHGWQPSAPVRISTILDVVCERLGVGKADLLGQGRHRRVVLARALVAYLGREMTTHSYPEIADALGRRYHSTVHTAAQRYGRQLGEDEIMDLGASLGETRLRELTDQIRHEVIRQGASR